MSHYGRPNKVDKTTAMGRWLLDVGVSREATRLEIWRTLVIGRRIGWSAFTMGGETVSDNEREWGLGKWKIQHLGPNQQRLGQIRGLTPGQR